MEGTTVSKLQYKHMPLVFLSRSSAVTPANGPRATTAFGPGPCYAATSLK